jgi:hypothetical protein
MAKMPRLACDSGATDGEKLAAVARLRRDLRFRQLTRRLYRLGERPVGEALLAVAQGRDPLEVLEEYAALDPEFVRYVGARDWPPQVWRAA